MIRTNLLRPVVSILLLLTVTTAQAQNATADQAAMMREQEYSQNMVARRIPTTGPNDALSIRGAWWYDDAISAELGLTDDQKAKIGRVFEKHSKTIVDNSHFLENEEVQLAGLLKADPVDATAARNQTNRVIEARGVLERTTAAMTLEMRQQLTGAQWVKLKAVQGRLTAERNSRTSLQSAPQPEPARNGQPGY